LRRRRSCPAAPPDRSGPDAMPPTAPAFPSRATGPDAATPTTSTADRSVDGCRCSIRPIRTASTATATAGGARATADASAAQVTHQELDLVLDRPFVPVAADVHVEMVTGVVADLGPLQAPGRVDGGERRGTLVEVADLHQH